MSLSLTDSLLSAFGPFLSQLLRLVLAKVGDLSQAVLLIQGIPFRVEGVSPPCPMKPDLTKQVSIIAYMAIRHKSPYSRFAAFRRS